MDGDEEEDAMGKEGGNFIEDLDSDREFLVLARSEIQTSEEAALMACELTGNGTPSRVSVACGILDVKSPHRGVIIGEEKSDRWCTTP